MLLDLWFWLSSPQRRWWSGRYLCCSSIHPHISLGSGPWGSRPAGRNLEPTGFGSSPDCISSTDWAAVFHWPSPWEYWLSSILHSDFHPRPDSDVTVKPRQTQCRGHETPWRCRWRSRGRKGVQKTVPFAPEKQCPRRNFPFCLCWRLQRNQLTVKMPFVRTAWVTTCSQFSFGLQVCLRRRLCPPPEHMTEGWVLPWTGLQTLCTWQLIQGTFFH